MTGGARVAIVVEDDPKLMERLFAENPVWAARTSGSKALAERLLGEKGAEPARFTIFDFDGDGDIEDQLLDVIHEVELHHGSSGGHPPLVQLDVYGTGLTQSLTATLERFGLASVQITPFGFSAVAPAS